MNSDLVERFVRQMVDEIPRNEWGAWLDKQIENWSLTDGDLCEMDSFASAVAVVYAEVAEYLGYRGGYGLGDHGHDEARAQADKMREKVRKAIGYSYP
jgi:hypothetical protein